VVLFVAVALGIQVGFALKSDTPLTLTPDNLPNQSLLRPGDAIPDLPVLNLEGRAMTLSDATDGRRTLVAVVLPGCDPCKKLLGEWERRGLPEQADDFQIILLASSGDNSLELGPLSAFADRYPIYFTDHIPLKEICGISTFPSLMGLGGDHTVKFVANGLVYDLDAEFFKKYL
jgi:hypothetical protein